MSDLTSANERATQIFTKPGLLKQVKKIQSDISRNKIDGVAGMEQLKELLIVQGEYNFEQQVKDFPYHVTLDLAKKDDVLGKQALDWLEANLSTDEYLAFPNEAIGIYKDCSSNIYFRSVSLATLFKLSLV